MQDMLLKEKSLEERMVFLPGAFRLFRNFDLLCSSSDPSDAWAGIYNGIACGEAAIFGLAFST